MSGYMMIIGRCWTCSALFAFNADRVPSLLVEGERQPICRNCIDRANELRRKNADPQCPPIVVLPGAYEGAEA